MQRLLLAVLPLLSGSESRGFNVFDVMHHGTHEKQLSNVFAWLLDRGGSHMLEDAFTRIFLQAVNRTRSPSEQLPLEAPYRVRQEADTSGAGQDIADIVLESDAVARVVVENYGKSDGHGHEYERYLAFARGNGGKAAVVLLCEEEDRSLLRDGWESAAVLTYESLLGTLHRYLGGLHEYAEQYPDQRSFLDQMYRKFSREATRMTEEKALHFIVTMCETGEAGWYGLRNKDRATADFADGFAEAARVSFLEGREVLQAVKGRLGRYTKNVLAPQLRSAWDGVDIGDVKVNWSGIYQWAVIIDVAAPAGAAPGDHIAVTFGPTAYRLWEDNPSGMTPDYTRLCIRARLDGSLVPPLQSTISMAQALSGLASDDVTLRDEVMSLWSPRVAATE